MDIAAEVSAKGREFAKNLARSLWMTTESLGTGLIHASADREDVDPFLYLHRLRALQGGRHSAS